MKPFHYWANYRNSGDKFTISHEEAQTWIQEYPMDIVIHCYKGDGSSYQEATKDLAVLGLRVARTLTEMSQWVAEKWFYHHN